MVPARGEVIEMALQRLNALAGGGAHYAESADVLQDNLVDPMRVFGKKEPHPERKLVAGGTRLIFGVSFIDNLVARFLHRDRVCAWKSSWDSIPVKPGIGMEDHHAARLLRGLKFAGDVVTCDVSSWDWSVQNWDFSNLVSVAMGYSPEGATSFAEARYMTIVVNAYQAWSKAPIMTSDGYLFARPSGVWPSGLYTTSADNSANRVMNHVIAARRAGVEPEIIANGDDSVERAMPEAIEIYLSLGKRVREVQEQNVASFSFCSHLWTPRGAIHQSIGKTLYKYLCDPTEEAFIGVAHAVRHRHDALELLEFMASALPTPASRC
jgi:hypothetical protein